MAGWDIGRAAMLTRWGCYLGGITENEAVGIRWDISRKAAEKLHSWRSQWKQHIKKPLGRRLC